MTESFYICKSKIILIKQGGECIYMNTGKALLEHQADIISGMTDILAKRFFKYSRNDSLDDDTLIDLSKSVGYLTLVNNSVSKTFKQEKRLKSLEEKLKNTPINTTMFEEAPLEKYR